MLVSVLSDYFYFITLATNKTYDGL